MGEAYNWVVSICLNTLTACKQDKMTLENPHQKLLYHTTNKKDMVGIIFEKIIFFHETYRWIWNLHLEHTSTMPAVRPFTQSGTSHHQQFCPDSQCQIPMTKSSASQILVVLCLFFLIQPSNGLARPEKPPHDIKCTGWHPVCSSLYGTIIGPLRVNGTLHIDCLSAFYSSALPHGMNFSVQTWLLPNGKEWINKSIIEINNIQEHESGNYSCILDIQPHNHTTTITWPIKVYQPASNHTDTALIWLFNAILSFLVIFVIFKQLKHYYKYLLPNAKNLNKNLIELTLM